MREALEIAVQAAKSAGAIILDFHHRDAHVETKGQSFNLVTEADLQAEKCILSIIREAFPNHSILSEEKGATQPGGEFLWAVDPLDGTSNFAHGFPFFAVSIALWHAGTPLLGVVYDPLRDELFQAIRGQGAQLNDEPIHVSSAALLRESLLCTGFYYDRGDVMRQTLRQMEAFLSRPVRDVRRTGSAALDQCYVAAGRLDGFWELQLSPWDYAAGSLIIKEAGGTVTDVRGGPYGLFMNNIAASNGLIHEAMLEVTRESFGFSGAVTPAPT